MDERAFPIDYTNIGYEALREAMLRLAQESVPEYTDFSANDLGVLLIELFAYACDVTLYYQTRLAGNLLPATSDEPEALVQLLRLIGYELRPPSPATADLRLAFDALEPTPIVLTAGTQFFASVPSGDEVVFETEREHRIQNPQLTPPDVANQRYFFPIPVVQGATIRDEAVGISDGSPSQIYPLRGKPVIAGSIRVTVTEAPGVETRWTEVPSLAYSGPADRHFAVQRDAEGAVALLFGDTFNGMVPPRGTVAFPVTIEATYRVGGGPVGNVPANTAFTASAPPGGAPLPGILEATNPIPASGGALGEEIERARAFAPRLFRTQERAVTAEDYADLARQFPGVGKARAVRVDGHQAALYVAPAGRVAEPSELLRRDLLAFFESRRMAAIPLKILAPLPADIYLRATVRAQPYFSQADVRAAAEQAVAAYLDFDAVEFGQSIYLSKVYDVIQSLPQVASLTVTEFSRRPYLSGLDPAAAIDPDGIIELLPHELPRPGYRDHPLTPPFPTVPDDRRPIVLDVQGGVLA